MKSHEVMEDTKEIEFSRHHRTGIYVRSHNLRQYTKDMNKFSQDKITTSRKEGAHKTRKLFVIDS